MKIRLLFGPSKQELQLQKEIETSKEEIKSLKSAIKDFLIANNTYYGFWDVVSQFEARTSFLKCNQLEKQKRAEIEAVVTDILKARETNKVAEVNEVKETKGVKETK